MSSRPASFPDDVWNCVTDKVRGAILAALDVMDTHADDDFARMNRLAASLFDVPSAAIAVVDDARSSLVSAFGTEIRQVELKESLAAYAMAARGILVVPDAAVDPRFRESALVQGKPGIRFYVGAPVTVKGQRIGALQVFAPEPRKSPDPRLLTQFSELAETTGRLFELKDAPHGHQAPPQRRHHRTRLAERAALGRWVGRARSPPRGAQAGPFLVPEWRSARG